MNRHHVQSSTRACITSQMECYIDYKHCEGISLGYHLSVNKLNGLLQKCYLRITNINNFFGAPPKRQLTSRTSTTK